MSITSQNNPLSGRPVVFGEVLFDRFPDGHNVLGGAPFNVAWHLQGFGLKPLFISRIGADESGAAVVARMENWHMDLSGLQHDFERPTGSVSVRIVDGEPAYSIEEDQAYDHIDREIATSLVDGSRYSLLYHGSLINRHPISADALRSVKASLGCSVFIDINLRPPWWRAEEQAALLTGARWLKLNEGELANLLNRNIQTEDDVINGANDLRERYGLVSAIVTRGSNGAFLIAADSQCSSRAGIVEGLVDTVGAGDAFSAVTIVGLGSGWTLQEILERAGEFSAAICAQRGATSDNPDLYRHFREQWCVDRHGRVV